jgi:hypothetical protein
VEKIIDKVKEKNYEGMRLKEKERGKRVGEEGEQKSKG